MTHLARRSHRAHRANRRRRAVLPVAAALAVAGCGASTSYSAPAQGHAAATATVAVGPTSLGQVLTAAGGRVIYLLTADGTGNRSCSDACLQAWPPVVVHGQPVAGQGVSARLGVLALGGGQQLTVDGHPAYTYVGDSGPDQVTGEGIHSFGGVWWAFSPAGAAVTTPASPGAGPTTTSGGASRSGGY